MKSKRGAKKLLELHGKVLKKEQRRERIDIVL